METLKEILNYLFGFIPFNDYELSQILKSLQLKNKHYLLINIFLKNMKTKHIIYLIIFLFPIIIGIIIGRKLSKKTVINQETGEIIEQTEQEQGFFDTLSSIITKISTLSKKL